MGVHTPLLAMTSLSRELYDQPDLPLAKVSIAAMTGLPAHAQIIEGAWPAPSGLADSTIQVAVHRDLAEEMNLNIGERYLLMGNLEIEIAGVWRANDLRDPVWFDPPGFVFSRALWVPEETYRTRVEPVLDDSVGRVSWFVVMDERDLNFQHAERYARGLVRLDTELHNQLPDIRMDYSPLEPLTAYRERAQSLVTLLYAIGSPMVLLALVFIGLTSNIAVQQHALEVATLRSRGTSRFQVVMMNLMESLVLLAVALPLSLVSGWYAADAMRRTLSFLQFTPRPLLSLSYDGLNPFLLGGAALLILGARSFPAWGISRRTIVKMKQEQARRMVKPLWERFYLDFLLLLPTAYAYLVLRRFASPDRLIGRLLTQLELEDVSIEEAYRFLSRAGLPVGRFRPVGEPYRDPLLFVAPALFAFAVCMITTRVVPLVARALAALVEKLPGVSFHLSLQQIARQPQDHASPVLLVMISLSLAIFSASAAKTLDQWLLDSVYYKTGADLIVREVIPDTGATSESGLLQGGSRGGDATAGLTSADLDIEDSMWYAEMQDILKLPGLEQATRVGKYRARFSSGHGETRCWIMGIDRLEFPQVAFFRDDFAPTSLGALMNALAAEPMGVLIPRYLALEQRLTVGDRLVMATEIEDMALERDLVVVGIYDYFPTVYPDELPTLVVNLEYIFGNPDAVTGYDLWLDVAEDVDVRELVAGVEKAMSVELYIRDNALEDVKRGQDQPERVGLFGVLNIGFLTAGLMSGIGFVLYSYASLRRRFIQLGILQAIGLSVRQLMGYLVLEQLLLMGIAISGGAIVGLITSYTFVPFLQTGPSPGGQVPPFQVLIGWAEAGWLSLSFGAVLFLTMVGTIIYLARLKMFEAVKLGETV